MRENELQGRLLKRLRAKGGLWDNNHGSAFSGGGRFDITGCVDGQHVSIELKAPGKYTPVTAGLTPAQWAYYHRAQHNGSLCLVGDNEDYIIDILEREVYAKD